MALRETEGIFMKAVRVLVAVCFALLLASCSIQQTWEIFGKWQSQDGTEMVHFFQDGVVTYNEKGINLTSTYKMMDPKHVKINLGRLGSFTAEVKVGKDSLVMTGTHGKTVTFHRLK